MANYNPQPYYSHREYWPSTEELIDPSYEPYETPIDHELQTAIGSLLKSVLASAWADRQDWFFGINMGIYYDDEKPPFVADGFLNLGVERILDDEEHIEFPIWQQNNIPVLVLEIVTKTYRKEYTKKKENYANIGVLYYVVYNPHRLSNPTLEVCRLEDGIYILQPQTYPIWLPEIGLGIGREEGTYLGITREWVYWYDEQGKRLLTPEERAQKMAEKLRSLGVDPETLF